MDTFKIEREIAEMAKLARVGQATEAIIDMLSPETRRAIIEEIATANGYHLLARMPSSLFAEFGEAKK